MHCTRFVLRTQLVAGLLRSDLLGLACATDLHHTNHVGVVDVAAVRAVHRHLDRDRSLEFRGVQELADDLAGHAAVPPAVLVDREDLGLDGLAVHDHLVHLGLADGVLGLHLGLEGRRTPGHRHAGGLGTRFPLGTIGDGAGVVRVHGVGLQDAGALADHVREGLLVDGDVAGVAHELQQLAVALRAEFAALDAVPGHVDLGREHTDIDLGDRARRVDDEGVAGDQCLRGSAEGESRQGEGQEGGAEEVHVSAPKVNEQDCKHGLFQPSKQII